MLKGQIYITNTVDVIRRLPLGPNSKILDMDEEALLPESPHIIKATTLLPPVEAKIAEIDGDEEKYDYLYHRHLLSEFNLEFMSAVIAFLYYGNNFMIYLPEDPGYNNTSSKFCYHMFGTYGIHIGVVGNHYQNSQCYYDMNYLPMWLELLYTHEIISPDIFLAQYSRPIDQNPLVFKKLVFEVRPYADTISEQIQALYELAQGKHMDSRVHAAIRGL